MKLQLQISLLNAIEYIQEITNYDFEYIANDILGIDFEVLSELLSFKK